MKVTVATSHVKKTHKQLLYAILTFALAALLAACGSDTAQSPAAELETASSDARFLFQKKDGSNSSHAILYGLITPYPKGLIGGLPVDNTLGETVQIYACRAGGIDNFVSKDSNCEGQERLGYYDFLLYKDGGSNRTALYRCLDISAGNHYLSRVGGCGSDIDEGLLGYFANVKISVDPFYYYY